MNIKRISVFFIAICFVVLLNCSALASSPDLTDFGELRLNKDAVWLEGVSGLCTSDSGAVLAAVTARGCESDVFLVVGIAENGTISSITVVSHEETPMLGGKALEDAYLANYLGLNDVSQVDSYTGATYTSNAIKECCVIAINQFKSFNGIEFEKAKSDEDLAYESALGFLGNGITEIECDSPVKYVEKIYASDIGYVFFVSGNGYYEDQPIKLAVFIKSDGKVSDIDVIEQHETPGNGDQVFNEGYLNFYQGGKKFSLFDMNDGSIIVNSFSGATTSSFGVFRLVDAATKQFSALQ